MCAFIPKCHATAIFKEVNAYLREHKLTLKEGTIVDATIMFTRNLFQ